MAEEVGGDALSYAGITRIRFMGQEILVSNLSRPIAAPQAMAIY